MTTVYVDATTLIALGTIDELDLLEGVGEPLVVLPSVTVEVTTEPARTNLERFCDAESVRTDPPIEPADEQAQRVLDDGEVNGDVRLVAVVIAHGDAEDVGIISDDRRVRTVCQGLGATVTGTIGVLVRAVDHGLAADEAQRILRRLDEHGLHMTAALRDRASVLIEDASGR